jgi:hypothetical protein
MADTEYPVGYKKPPQSNQFQKGQSGNPKGRPKGTKNLATDLKEELSQRIVTREGETVKKLSKQRAMIKALINKALQGDIRAMSTTLKMMERLIDDEPKSPEVEPLEAEDAALMELFIERYKNGDQS